MSETIEDAVRAVLRTPLGRDERDASFGFAALAPDGATKPGLSAQVLSAMAREALTRCIPGATFNEVTAHRDENGQLMRIEIDYMDEIHDPSSRTTTVDFPKPA